MLSLCDTFSRLVSKSSIGLLLWRKGPALIVVVKIDASVALFLAYLRQLLLENLYDRMMAEGLIELPAFNILLPIGRAILLCAIEVLIAFFHLDGPFNRLSMSQKIF